VRRGEVTRRIGLTAASLLLALASGAAAQSGSTGAGTPSGTSGAAVGGGTNGGTGDRLTQPMASVPPVQGRREDLRAVDPRAALGEDRFTNRVDDPPRGDRDRPMPPGGDRPLRIETEHDRTGMRPAQTPGQTTTGR